MAVGDNRHYVVDKIAPRHFLQTARKSGVAAATVESIFQEITAGADAAISTVQAALPPGFPGALADSIIGGLRSRLRLFEWAAA